MQLYNDEQDNKAKALTAALYKECNTMTIDTQVINKTNTNTTI